MSGGGGRKPRVVTGGEEAEVEALLRAAQDAVLLKLQANSHLVSSPGVLASASNPAPLDLDAAAVDPLDAELARRFDALKTRAQAPAPGAGEGSAATGDMQELEARFAALKGVPAPAEEARVRLEDLGAESSEDEVDKVMRWAMDAARLDVATAGGGGGERAKRAEEDDEEEDGMGSASSSDEDDDEDEKVQVEMARKRKQMMAKKKWFF